MKNIDNVAVAEADMNVGNDADDNANDTDVDGDDSMESDWKGLQDENEELANITCDIEQAEDEEFDGTLVDAVICDEIPTIKEEGKMEDVVNNEREESEEFDGTTVDAVICNEIPTRKEESKMEDVVNDAAKLKFPYGHGEIPSVEPPPEPPLMEPPPLEPPPEPPPVKTTATLQLFGTPKTFETART